MCTRDECFLLIAIYSQKISQTFLEASVRV